MAAYKDLLFLIGELYGANEDVLSGKMRGRLQNLAKMQIPMGGQVGKGKSLDYGRSQIYQVIMCLELAELGLLPSHAALLVKSMWLRGINTESSLYARLEQEWKFPSDDDQLFVGAFGLMSATWAQEQTAPEVAAIMGEPLPGYKFFAPASKLGDALAAINSLGLRHFSVINLSALVREVERILKGVLPPA
jgi:hypothetical protein